MTYATFSTTAIKYLSSFTMTFIAFFMSVSLSVAQEHSIVSQTVNADQNPTNDTPASYSYFDKAPPSVLALAQKIERKQDITLADVKALPEGALNARYDAEITLLFFALTQTNLQAIDILLQAGADPYLVDQPSQQSARDFTFFIANVSSPDGVENTMKYRTKLLDIYLKNGGDPNHELTSGAKTPIIALTILMGNTAGARLLIDNGADPIKISQTGLSATTMLAIRRDDESIKLLKDIICQGAYDHATQEQVRKIITYLKPLGATDLQREENQRKLAMFILKKHPDFKDNVSTKLIFNGPIPWKTIGETSEKDLCNGR